MFFSPFTSVHQPAEIIRRLDNLLRIGTITHLDLSAARCRVKSGGLSTDWLPWVTLRAGNTRTWNPPTVGEQVLIVSLSGELTTGLVLFGINSHVYPPPSHSSDETITLYPDGAKISYNHASGLLKASGIQSATVQASKQVLIDCPETTVSGNVTIDGTLTVKGLLAYQSGMVGRSASDSPTGTATVIHGSIIQQGGQLISNGVVLDQHTHDGVEAGNAQTGLPK